MARILGIDYGTKKIGIATTDPLQIISSALTTVETKDIFSFLAKYLQEEEVECIVVGAPLLENGEPAQIAHLVVGFVRKLKELYPSLKIETQDERYTSKDAKRIILQSGAKKKKRRDKSLVDRVSAALILEAYMNRKRNYSE